jgi:hypothetical protein
MNSQTQMGKQAKQQRRLTVTICISSFCTFVFFVLPTFGLQWVDDNVTGKRTCLTLKGKS